MLKYSLDDILSDRISGSSALYRTTLDLFLNDSKHYNRPTIQTSLKRLKKTFPEMAVFDHLMQEMKNCPPNLIGAQLLNLKNGADDQISQISKHLNRFWRAPKSIVTYSRSSVVVSILKGRKNRVKSVLLSTAAPGNEGVTTARELTALGITTTLCTDAALPGLIRSDHIVLLGADRVGQKLFVNKTGTFPLLLAAREVGAKSFLLFESFKKTTRVNPKFNPTNMVKTEIIPDARSKIKVINCYFEEIDLRFVDHLISG